MTVNDLIHTAAWTINKLRAAEEQCEQLAGINQQLRDECARLEIELQRATAKIPAPPPVEAGAAA